MKWKRAILSATTLPGLGPLLWGPHKMDRFAGGLWAFVIFAVSMIFMLGLFRIIMELMPDPTNIPLHPKEILDLSFNLQKKAMSQAGPFLAKSITLLILLWVGGVFHSLWADYKAKSLSLSPPKPQKDCD